MPGEASLEVALRGQQWHHGQDAHKRQGSHEDTSSSGIPLGADTAPTRLKPVAIRLESADHRSRTRWFGQALSGMCVGEQRPASVSAIDE
jgi:hypothetical protein